MGKTSIACAAAVKLADRGRRLLLVSTDPASNLDAVLETPLANHPRPVNGVPGLDAMDIDPELAAQEYRQRTIDPYRASLPQARRSSSTTSFFDTAPTGHRVRLLQLPAAMDRFVQGRDADASCPRRSAPCSRRAGTRRASTARPAVHTLIWIKPGCPRW